MNTYSRGCLLPRICHLFACLHTRHCALSSFFPGVRAVKCFDGADRCVPAGNGTGQVKPNCNANCEFSYITEHAVPVPPADQCRSAAAAAAAASLALWRAVQSHADSAAESAVGDPSCCSTAQPPSWRWWGFPCFQKNRAQRDSQRCRPSSFNSRDVEFGEYFVLVGIDEL